MDKKSYSFLFVVLTAFFVVCLITSNIIAGKLWEAPFGIVLTTAILIFPIVYIVGDVIPEVYGLKAARKVIWLGFGFNLLVVGFFYMCLKLPYPVFWENQEAFEIVLGFTPRLLVASFIAYLIGTNANALVMVGMKKATKGKWLWSRTITSTLVGESLDTIVFITIAFYGILPNPALINMILAQAIFKISYEILATPLTYLVVNKVKKYESTSLFESSPVE